MDFHLGQRQPVLHRGLHVRDVYEDLRPQEVLLHRTLERLRLHRRHALPRKSLSQRPHRKVFRFADFAQSGKPNI